MIKMADLSDNQQISLRNLGIRRKIFSTNEAEFFFINNAYLNAYIQLLNGIRHQSGLFVLTSEAGIGKTFLLRKLANEAPENIKFVFCYSTNFDYDNLLTFISDQLGVVTHEGSLADKLAALKNYLNKRSVHGISVALLIDDAHHLAEDVLSKLIALSSLEFKGGHGLRIVLSGTPVLEDILKQAQISHGPATDIVYIRLQPLTTLDVATFISRQVRNAGVLDVNSLFSPPVTEKIACYTGGIPRLINTLCERALLLTQLNGEATVSIAAIDEAASELMLREKEIATSTTAATSLGATSPDDATQVVKLARGSTSDANQLSEENRKKIIDSFLVDEAGADLDQTVNESLLQDTSAYPVTAVYFEAAHSDSADQLVQTERSSGRNEKILTEEARKNLLESLLVDEDGTSTSLVMRREDLQVERKGLGFFRSTRLQMAFFVLLALLAGLLGGVGSIYLFQLAPEKTPATPPAQLATSAPAPIIMQPAPTILPATDHDKGAGSTQVVGVEPPATPAVTAPPPAISPEPPAQPVRELPVEPSPAVTAAPPAVSPEPLAGPVSTSPSASLESSPVPTPVTEVAPPVAGIETPVPPPTPVQTTAETPLISSYMSSGDTLLARGDVASARLFYEAAAHIGYAAAMTAVGKTYDPVVLGQLGIKGFRADPVKAAEWYLKAEKAGDSETTARLEGLKRWLSDSPALKENEVNALRQLLR
jgi:general secretion pathway protein A